MTLPKLVRSLEFVVRRFVQQTTDYRLQTTNWRRRRLGFSLIELLVVITIIAVLIGAGTVSYTNSQQKGRDGKRKADLKAIQQALELYFQQNKYYPPWTEGWRWCATATQLGAALEPTYIQKVPKDPLYAGTSKDYFFDRSNKVYVLVAVLENTNDPEYATYTKNSFNETFCEPLPGAGSQTYNYRVTQP